MSRAHVNTTAVQVMPVVPVNARTRIVARWWPPWCGTVATGPVPGHLRVIVWEAGKNVACWTVTYP